MKGIVIYSSLTGNTYKVARYVYDNMKEIVKFVNIDDVVVDSLDEFDFLVLAYWNRRSTLDLKSIEFIESIKDKKIIALGTLGAYPDGLSGERMMKNAKELINKDNTLVNQFICQGRIDPQKTLRRLKIPKGRPHHLDEEGLKRHIESRNHPDLIDLKNALNTVKKGLECL